VTGLTIVVAALALATGAGRLARHSRRASRRHCHRHERGRRDGHAQVVVTATARTLTLSTPRMWIAPSLFSRHDHGARIVVFA